MIKFLIILCHEHVILRLSLGMQFLLLKDLIYMTRQEEWDPSNDIFLDFDNIAPQVCISTFV